MRQIPTDLAWFSPTTERAALDLVAQYPQATLMGGGQTLVPQWGQTAYPQQVICLNQISALKGIKLESNRLLIGAGVSLEELAQAALVQQWVPALSQLVLTMGDAFMRHRATVAGALCTTTSSHCIAVALLGLNAQVHTSRRHFYVHEYFSDRAQGLQLQAGELIQSISLELPTATSYQSVRLVPARPALLSLFASRLAGRFFVGIGGLGMPTLRATALEQQLQQQTPDQITAFWQGFFKKQPPLGSNEAEKQYIQAQTQRLFIQLLAELSDSDP